MDKKQELELWKRWKNGDDSAKNALVKSLTPLLSSQVNRFVASGLPKVALDTESKRLAIEAFKTYDPTKSALNTHVVNHQKHLQRFVLNYQNVGKIPENRGLSISKFKNIKRNLMEELDREPTAAELATELSWSIREVDRMERELRKDLTMIKRSEEDFFDDLMYKTDEIQDIIYFIYYESDPEEKLILEHSIGMGGKKILDIKEIALRLGKPDFYIRRKRKLLAEKIETARTLGL